MDTGGELVSFSADATEGVVRVTDELESRDIVLGVDAGVSLQSTNTARFVFPVDAAVSLTTANVRIGATSLAYLRDGEGEHLGEFTATPQRFERGDYAIDFQGSVQGYLRVEDAAFTVAYDSKPIDTADIVVEFEDETTVFVGARSLHSRPQTTLEVPDDPAAVAEAVSYLGSSIKEFSSERSWPTLRGHPPAIRPGDELAIPSWLSKPDTGVTIEVPPEYECVYPVAPLAFYLGATVEIGDEPALHLDNGYTESLETPAHSLGDCAESLLTRAFFFDTLVRHDGYYALPRREYDLVAGDLPFYPPNLYGEPISDQLIEYLEVDPAVLDGLRPAWGCRATLRPRVEDAALLSSLAHVLAPIRVVDDGASTSTTATEPAIPEVGTATTSDDVPPDTTRLRHEAFAARRQRELPTPADATLAFVLGDADRADALRASLEAATEPRVHEATTVVADGSTDALRRTLDADPDFLYYEPPTSGVETATDATLRDANPTGSCPAVVALGRPTSAAVQRALAAGGTVAGLTAAGPLSPTDLARLAAPLLTGHTLQWSATLADVDATHRFFGSPTATLVSRADAGGTTVTDVQPVSPDEHVLHRVVPVTENQRVGSVSRVKDESVNNDYYLVGTSAPEAEAHTTDHVVDAIAEDGRHVRLGGDTYYGDPEDAATAVRRVARESHERRQE